jgi:hypothetical protein
MVIILLFDKLLVVLVGCFRIWNKYCKKYDWIEIDYSDWWGFENIDFSIINSSQWKDYYFSDKINSQRDNVVAEVESYAIIR